MRQKKFLCLKSIVFVWLFTILLVAGGKQVCFAAEENTLQWAVYDDAALLTPEEIETLEGELDAAGEKTGWNLLMLTTDDTKGKTTREYADDFFDAIAENGDGVALLIDMQNREIYISTGGIAIRYLTDERIESVLDGGYEQITDGNYEQCLSVMLQDVVNWYEKGIPSDQYEYDEETGKVTKHYSLTAEEIMVAVATGLIVGCIIFFVVVGSYKLKIGKYTYDFHKFGSVNVKKRSDVLVNTVVTHRHISENNGGSGHSGSGSSSGRSTVHTSSSGVSHGGGGRKF